MPVVMYWSGTLAFAKRAIDMSRSILTLYTKAVRGILRGSLIRT